MINQNQHITTEYFDRLSDEYSKLIVESQLQIYRNVNPVLTRRVRGRTLTLGSGPVMNFGDLNVEYVVSLDISYGMLSKLPRRPKVIRVNADAQALPFDRGTFDVVVVPFLIHHMAQDDVLDTDRALTYMLGEAGRVLRRDGRLIIVDLFIPPILEVFERSFYRPALHLLNRSGRPMMYFYSLPNFNAILSNCKLAMAFDQVIGMEDKIMPTLLFPKFKIPARYHPARFHILEVTKLL